MREGLAANKINWLAGIINGTGNFILTEMREKGRAFADVLKKHKNWVMPKLIQLLMSKALMLHINSRF
jgi:hypothetical protein